MGVGGEQTLLHLLPSVQVTGLGVKKELQISLEQLKTNFKKHEVSLPLEKPDWCM